MITVSVVGPDAALHDHRVPRMRVRAQPRTAAFPAINGQHHRVRPNADQARHPTDQGTVIMAPGDRRPATRRAAPGERHPVERHPATGGRSSGDRPIDVARVGCALLDWWLVDDDERLVDLSGDEHRVDEHWVDEHWVDDSPVLPETTRDDTDAGWGERTTDNEERLLAERPPHWD